MLLERALLAQFGLLRLVRQIAQHEQLLHRVLGILLKELNELIGHERHTLPNFAGGYVLSVYFRDHGVVGDRAGGQGLGNQRRTGKRKE